MGKGLGRVTLCRAAVRAQEKAGQEDIGPQCERCIALSVVKSVSYFSIPGTAWDHCSKGTEHNSADR